MFVACSVCEASAGALVLLVKGWSICEWHGWGHALVTKHWDVLVLLWNLDHAGSLAFSFCLSFLSCPHGASLLTSLVVFPQDMQSSFWLLLCLFASSQPPMSFPLSFVLCFCLGHLLFLTCTLLILILSLSYTTRVILFVFMSLLLFLIRLPSLVFVSLSASAFLFRALSNCSRCLSCFL